ncbi:hypothetical protein P8605_08210 [Streptomyces sp. T-3]|nr:hypothetical protein [Streptomyces sp. T-3]
MSVRANFLAILAASLGSTIMWLLLVPYFSEVANSNSLVGLLGLERQVLIVLGGLLVGLWADEGRPVRKFALLEGIQLVLALLLLTVIGLGGAAHPTFLLVWTGVRFALVGASTVVAYRMLADVSGSNARGAVFHMVTSPQGAMVFASVICVLIPLWISQSFVAALIVDAVAAAVLTALLWRADLGPARERGALAFRRRHIEGRVASAVKSYWIPQLWPWNLVQLCFLASLSGMMVYGYFIAADQRLVSTETGFAATWFFYGLAFWVTAPLVKSDVRARRWALVFALVLVACGIAGALIGREQAAVHALLYVALTLVNAFWLHFTNTRILDAAPVEVVSQVRASMLFYLGVVFGLGEQLAGIAVDQPAGVSLMGLARAVGGVILVTWAAVLVLRESPGPTPSDEPQAAAGAKITARD